MSKLISIVQKLLLSPLPLAIVLISLLSCQSNRGNVTDTKSAAKAIKHLEWLSGIWENQQLEGRFVETWWKPNDSTLLAESYMIHENDTLFAEKVSLEYLQDTLRYIVTTLNQNSMLPVSFKLVSQMNHEFVFENKAHDFPQQIIYRKINPDSIHARIEGYESGKFRMEEFPMKRLK